MSRKIKAEIFSRVAGYFRPVQNWNRGKQEEFSERKAYNIAKQENNVNGKFAEVS